MNPITVFYHYQWDLNYKNPRVFHEIVSALLVLANLGVDLVRLDAVIFSWKEKGTTSMNLPRVHELLKLLKLCTSAVVPELLFVAEAISSQEEVKPYLGSDNEPECDLAYNASLMACLWDAITRGNTQMIYKVHGQDTKKPLKSTWLNYIRCHDDIAMIYPDYHIEELGLNPEEYRKETSDLMLGESDNSFSRGLIFMNDESDPNKRIASSLASLCGVETGLEEEDEKKTDLGLKRMELLHAVILSIGGIPMIYAGDELATINNHDFTNDPEREKDTRWVSRLAMDWERAERRKVEGTLEHRAFQSLRKLISARQESSQLSDRTDLSYLNTGHNSILAYFRGTNKKVFCVYNFSSEEVEFEMSRIPIALHKSSCLVSGTRPEITDHSLKLQPYQYHWFMEN